jgi:hypothetical protein
VPPVIGVPDEPWIGLHQRDNRKLLATLQGMRDLGNTVLVVEHDDEETTREGRRAKMAFSCRGRGRWTSCGAERAAARVATLRGADLCDIEIGPSLTRRRSILDKAGS